MRAAGSDTEATVLTGNAPTKDDRLHVDWAIVSRRGKVDASIAGRSLVRFLVAGDVYPAELAWERHQSIGLFAQLLAR